MVGLGLPEWLKRILATTHAIENLIGTAIVFQAVPGMTKEWLQREVERILRKHHEGSRCGEATSRSMLAAPERIAAVTPR